MDRYDDEIELMDLLKVIWKWRYLIIAGTVICVAFVSVVCFLSPKIYSISMVLQPGILNINEEGNIVYVDSPNTIKAIIDLGTLQTNIANRLKPSNGKYQDNPLEFNTTIPKDSNLIKISFETQDVDSGIKVLYALNEALKQQYDESLKYHEDYYKDKIAAIKADLNVLKSEQKLSGQVIRDLSERIKDLKSSITSIEQQNNALSVQKDGIIQEETVKDKELFISILKSIDQRALLAVQYRNQIGTYLNEINNKKQAQIIRQNQIDQLTQKIENSEFAISPGQKIKIVRPPTASPSPIKPKTKLYVTIAAVAALFIMLFLAFFMEYFRNYKNMYTKDD